MSERRVTVAATQMACDTDVDANLAAATGIVREAAGDGANIVLIQELFATPYFCKDQLEEYFDLAEPVADSVVIRHMSELARELGVVLPTSFFERDNNAYYNSLVVIDSDGSVVSHYRKTHIPDGPGYQEKYYFSPGDTGFRVSDTAFGRIGVAVCWDQWFPETAPFPRVAGRGAIVLSHRDRQRAGLGPRQPRTLAAHDAGTRRRQYGAGHRVQSYRARAR